MAELFNNKYRIQSARCPNWNYGSNSAYFVTICTQNHEKYFGEIINQKMQLSHTGVIADILWYEIKNHAKNVELDAFVVMPNHVHGILILNGNNSIYNDNGNVGGNGNGMVETLHATSLPFQPNAKNEIMSKISPKHGSVSTIIRSYKSAVTRHAHRLGFEFAWQSRFHDHIVRNNESPERIRNYITNNPQNWNKDKFFMD
jgi:putative transposase